MTWFIIAAVLCVLTVTILILRGTTSPRARARALDAKIPKAPPKPEPRSVRRARWIIQNPDGPNRKERRFRMAKTGQFKTRRFRSRKYRRTLARYETLTMDPDARIYGNRGSSSEYLRSVIAPTEGKS